jgi:hypothetical protein
LSSKQKALGKIPRGRDKQQQQHKNDENFNIKKSCETIA